jgi:hypothetical protein
VKGEQRRDPRSALADAAAALPAMVGKPITVHEAPLEAMAATLAGFGLPTTIAGSYRR